MCRRDEHSTNIVTLFVRTMYVQEAGKRDNSGPGATANHNALDLKGRGMAGADRGDRGAGHVLGDHLLRVGIYSPITARETQPPRMSHRKTPTSVGGR
jgi:hypothetical protein